MFRNVFALLVGAVLLVLGFMASIVVFAVIAVLGLVVWGYLWWKTRELRRTMQQQTKAGQVIDGEATVVEEDVAKPTNLTPSDPPGGS